MTNFSFNTFTTVQQALGTGEFGIVGQGGGIGVITMEAVLMADSADLVMLAPSSRKR